MVNLEELQWFVVLAETEHVTEAAAELGISQPTLSRALARFESQARTPLFDRVNRRLWLNAYGQIMLEHATRSIAEMQSATERIAALRDPDTGRVRLAFLHSLANWYVPEQLRGFRKSAPAIGFDLFQGPAPEITQRVRSGQADIAITAPGPDGPGFGWHRLYVEQLCLAVGDLTVPSCRSCALRRRARRRPTRFSTYSPGRSRQRCRRGDRPAGRAGRAHRCAPARHRGRALHHRDPTACRHGRQNLGTVAQTRSDALSHRSGARKPGIVIEMFKQVCFFRKRPDMSMDEFIDYYENQHSRLSERLGRSPSIPNAVRYVRRYLTPERNPVTGEVIDPGYHCIMEIWWNSRADFENSQRVIADPKRLPAIKEDEARLFETHSNPMCSVVEYDSPMGPSGETPRVELV